MIHEPHKDCSKGPRDAFGWEPLLWSILTLNLTRKAISNAYMCNSLVIAKMIHLLHILASLLVQAFRVNRIAGALLYDHLDGITEGRALDCSSAAGTYICKQAFVHSLTMRLMCGENWIIVRSLPSWKHSPMLLPPLIAGIKAPYMGSLAQKVHSESVRTAPIAGAIIRKGPAECSANGKESGPSGRESSCLRPACVRK